MFSNFRRYIDICVELDIDADEYLLLFLIYNQDIENAKRYYRGTRGKEHFNRDTVNRLIHKRLLVNSGQKGEPYQFRNLYVTERFSMLFEKEVDADAYWEAYPDFIMIRDKPYPARNMSYERFQQVYQKLINGDAVMHHQMLQVLEFAKENDMIQVGMTKWFETRQYESVAKMMEKEVEQQQEGYGSETI